MTQVLMQMVGGPLDGALLPLHPQYEKAPTHLAVWCPDNGRWCNYANEKTGGVMVVDVYKIRMGVVLPTVRPRDAKVINMNYCGILSREDMLAVEQMRREQERKNERP